MAISKVVAAPVARKAFWSSPGNKECSLVQLFFNVNMSKQHGGLTELATEFRIDLRKLGPGQFVGFLNRARTKIKLFTVGNLFAYLSLEKGTITLETIGQIPAAFRSDAKVSFLPAFIAALESPIPLLPSEKEHGTKPSRRH